MLTAILLVVIVVGFFLFFIVTKKEMLTHLFSLNISNSANQFQVELENTANHIVKQLENQIAHLEYLLAEADDKIALLEEKIEKVQIAAPHDSAISHMVQEHNQTVETKEISKIAYSNPLYASETVPDLFAHEKEADLLQEFPKDQPKDQPKEMLTEDKRRLILAMTEQGYNVTEVAQAMGIGKGEIMLVLQLNKK